MNRAIILALAALILVPIATLDVAAQPTPAPRGQAGVSFSGGGGLSVEQAVVINGAANSFTGVQAEYAWLAQRYLAHKPKVQSLMHAGERKYDRHELEAPDGKPVVIFFDITSFFGKI